MSPALDILATILALVGAVLAWTFVAVYRKPPFNWHAYEAGRHLRRFTAGIALILTWSLAAFTLRAIHGDATWLDNLIQVGRVFIFGWVAVMIGSRLQILLQARKGPPPAELVERAEAREGEPSPSTLND